jgi:hypothetical protein
MSVLRAAFLLACAAAACGRAAEHDPARLAAPDTTPVAGVATVWIREDTNVATTTTTTTDTTNDVSAPEPELRPGAIGCRRTDTPRPVPDSEVVEDLRGGARFSCVLRKGRPPIEARADADQDGFVVGVRITASTWERPWSQALDAWSTGRPYIGADVLEVIDYDKDGWGDLRMLDWTGATGNRGYQIFRFDPRRERFVRDSVLSATDGADTLPGPPCVQGFRKNGGRRYDLWTICLERGRWEMVMKETQDYIPGKPLFLLQRRERRGGRMVVVRSDTLTEDDVWDHQ